MMSSKLAKVGGAALLTFGMVAFTAAQAEAAFVLILDDPAVAGIEKTITDNLVGDLDPTVGAISFTGPLGGGSTWTINLTGGLSKPNSGSTATTPYMDLTSRNTSAGAGTLNIYLYDTDFSDPTSPSNFIMTIGGTAAGVTAGNGTVRYQAYTSLANDGALANLIGTLGPSGPGAFSGTTSGLAPTDAAYSLTQYVQIVHAGAGTSSFDAELLAPEPTVMALFGLGLFGVGAAARRRRASAI